MECFLKDALARGRFRQRIKMYTAAGALTLQ